MGRRAKALKPSEVVNCGDPHIEREVGKTFKTQIWLQDILRSNGRMFVALVVNLSHRNPKCRTDILSCYRN